MKKSKKMSILGIFAIVLFVLSSCKTTSNKMNASNTIPAAEGEVYFSKLHEGNTGIDVRVRHLALPEKLNMQTNSYVVWVQGNGEETPQNVGMMKVDRDLNARLITKTPLSRFDLFITAEPSGQVTVPSGERLLWTSYSR